MQFLKFSCLVDLLDAFPTEEACRDYLEKVRWRNGVVSPFDPQSTVYKCKDGRYKCRTSGKYFNVKTRSIFEHTRLPLKKWIVALYMVFCHRKGISSHQLASDISVCQKTAWKMLHKIRGVIKPGSWLLPMTGIIEADEVFLGGKNRFRHVNKKTFYKHDDKAVVFGMVQRKGQARIQHIPSKQTELIQEIIFKGIQKNEKLMTDEGTAYAGLGAYYNHQTVVHSNFEYVRGEVHTNTIENLWSCVKKTLKGTYIFTSKKHLQAYLDEFAFRYNNRKDSPHERLGTALRRCFTPLSSITT